MKNKYKNRIIEVNTTNEQEAMMALSHRQYTVIFGHGEIHRDPMEYNDFPFIFPGVLSSGSTQTHKLFYDAINASTPSNGKTYVAACFSAHYANRFSRLETDTKNTGFLTEVNGYKQAENFFNGK